MSCPKESVPSELWIFLMRLPAFRYMKAPVDNPSELYEKYYDGLERGSFAYVYNKNTFYAWYFEEKTWRPVSLPGSGGNPFDFFEKVIPDNLNDGDAFFWDTEKKKFVIINLSLWGTEEY